MVNEDIVTALKNSIQHGESLQTAIQIMINSGYNPAEVKEASRLIGGGVMPAQQPRPGEQLTMPAQKRILSKQPKFKTKSKQRPQPFQQPVQPLKKPLQTQPLQRQPLQQTTKQIKQQIAPQKITPQLNTQPLTQQSKDQSLTKQLGKIKPPKSRAKEIFLLILLLILIGLLVVTIIYKDIILGWFG